MISIIIPAYNEADALTYTVEECLNVLDKNFDGGEVIVVDDCSNNPVKISDDTRVRYIRNLNNLGYGASLKRGIATAKNDEIAILDADGTYPPNAILECHEMYLNGYDLVIGDRSNNFRDRLLFKGFMRKLLHLFVAFITGMKINDVNSGLRLFSKEKVERFLLRFSNGFSFTTSQTISYSLSKLSICFVPIQYGKRKGKTKVKFFRDAFRAFQYMVELLVIYNPIKLFLLLSIFTFILGLPFLIIAFFLSISILIFVAFTLLMMMILLVSIGIMLSRFKEM